MVTSLGWLAAPEGGCESQSFAATSHLWLSRGSAELKQGLSLKGPSTRVYIRPWLFTNRDSLFLVILTSGDTIHASLSHGLPNVAGVAK